MKHKIYYSDYIFSGKDKINAVYKLIEDGTEYVELTLEGVTDYNYLFYNLPGGIQYSIHPPTENINLASVNVKIRKHSIEIHKNIIAFASRLKASYVVIHPGYCQSKYFNNLSKALASEALFILNDYAKPLGIKLAVENVGTLSNSVYTQEEFTNLLKDMDTNLQYLINVGHANINKWNLPELINTAGNRILGIHLHDNDGTEDSHLTIGEGTIQWSIILECLRKFSHSANLVLEYSPSIPISKLYNSKNMLISKLK
jgi:sugar phosphate isomerase/epimerase